jgi:NADH dehydrogenase FAD-containing subunit
MPTKQVILVGAGHAHLHVARQADAFHARDAALTVVSPGTFWYSGLATGMLGEEFDAEVDQIDSQRVAEEAGGTFIRSRVTGLDSRRRFVQLENGEELSYDLLSFNVGSEVAAGGIVGAAEHGWLVKPIARLWDLRQAITAAAYEGRTIRIAVIGGGPTGCEIACNLHGLCERLGAERTVRLIAGTDRLIPNGPLRATRLIHQTLEDYGVALNLNTRVTAVEAGSVLCEGGARYEAEFTVIATGLQPPGWLFAAGLTREAGGGLAVDARLRHPSKARIFGAGDCIDFLPRALPKLGVFGVRQAPVLEHNLLAALDEGGLKEYRPQRRYLSILNLGDGRGLAMWGPLAWKGYSAGRLKAWLDRLWMNRYR